MNSQNICKFIYPRDQGQLEVKAFIFESETPHSGETLIGQNTTMYLALNGSGFIRCGDQFARINPGTLFFSFEGSAFQIENTGNLVYYYISFCGDRADELLARFGINERNFAFNGYDGLLPHWKDSIVRANDENIDLLSESLILYTFSKLKKPKKEARDAVAAVLTYLEEHFTEPEVNLETVAKALQYNGKYLSSKFKKELGMGFSEYLRLLRVKHAVMLMDNGVTSVKNVAALSGFADPMYFSKVFMDVVGCSPSEYKRNVSV